MPKARGFYTKDRKKRPITQRTSVGSNSKIENAARKAAQSSHKHHYISTWQGWVCSGCGQPKVPFASEKDRSQIGRTIYEQIQQSRIRNEPFDLFRAVNADQIVWLDKGIQFRVKGDKFKGKIVVKLNGRDLYDVEFWRWNKGKVDMKKVDELNDIYADNLVASIWPKIVYV